MFSSHPIPYDLNSDYTQSITLPLMSELYIATEYSSFPIAIQP
ncbi:hypothetical protein PPHE_b0535 [Pseudoalteromonas phenolica O-BC30]|nr:hypothetical protein [Pseudoalteromonas phenolica O-BC30]